MCVEEWGWEKGKVCVGLWKGEGGRVQSVLSFPRSPVQVMPYLGDEEVGACLKGCDVVAIPAGVPRKPGEGEEGEGGKVIGESEGVRC